jgi:CelD/BcsL family acetyltransferase involved in cellulose biosynthesis
MSDLTMECLESFAQFQSVRPAWDEFLQRCFPGNYNRSHAWLSAFWKTYHQDRKALVYLQRQQADGRIVAAAPLLIRTEIFSGFPVRSLITLGMGLGGDEFLISPEARGFVRGVFRDLTSNRHWHVARLRRVNSGAFLQEVTATSIDYGCVADCEESEDSLIRFPGSYDEYLRSRSRNFRRNLGRATSRLQEEGDLRVEVLDPIAEGGRVAAVGREISGQSWKYRQGKSHFNDRGGVNFYANLSGQGRGGGGEEFTVLLVNDRPVAYLLGCRRGRTYFAIDTAYHADFRHVSVGRILMCRIIERLIGAGEVELFDFEGSGEFKDYYATDARKVTQVIIYNRALYPRCINMFKRSSLYGKLQELKLRGAQIQEC